MDKDDSDDRKMPARDGPGDDGKSLTGPWSNQRQSNVFQESSSSTTLPPAAAAAAAGSAEAMAPDVWEDHHDDDDDKSPDVAAELPYLITNYLLRYNPHNRAQETRRSSGQEDRTDENEAVRRIRRAAVELAHAFGALGAFGTATRVSLVFVVVVVALCVVFSLSANNPCCLLSVRWLASTNLPHQTPLPFFAVD